MRKESRRRCKDYKEEDKRNRSLVSGLLRSISKWGYVRGFDGNNSKTSHRWRRISIGRPVIGGSIVATLLLRSAKESLRARRTREKRWDYSDFKCQKKEVERNSRKQ